MTAGSSAHVAAVKVREKALLVASHLLEVDASDLDIDGGHVVVKGAVQMKISLGQIAKTMAGTAGFVLPGNLPPGLEAVENVVIDRMTYGNGSAVAEVEVDIKTAAVKITRIVFVHDAGKIINPMLAEGQIVGAIAHGIGNALYEWMGYDDQGQPLTTTLADYLLVTMSEMPALRSWPSRDADAAESLRRKGNRRVGTCYRSRRPSLRRLKMPVAVRYSNSPISDPT